MQKPDFLPTDTKERYRMYMVKNDSECIGMVDDRRNKVRSQSDDFGRVGAKWSSKVSSKAEIAELQAALVVKQIRKL